MMNRKRMLWIGWVLICMILLVGCTTVREDSKESDTFTYTYKAANGKSISVEKVPKNPKRIVVLGRFTGDVLQFGGHLVGVDLYSKQDPLFKDKLKNIATVSEENVEGIAKLKPDLIIGLSSAKNAEKIKKIAPTILYDYGAYSYLDQPIEIARAMNQEEKGKVWKKNFVSHMTEAGKKIKQRFGEGTTISILENFNKQLTIFGENFGRGSEILYQGMKLKMPQSVKEVTHKMGYATISQEALPKYVGDYLVVSYNPKEENSFMKSHTYQNLPAVRNKRVLLADQRIFNFNDSMSLDYQLKFFEKNLLNYDEK